MTQTTTTYLQQVNNVINEAGADLALFASDGSDFATLGSFNTLQQKIKTWVSRAWKEIQQDSYDWDYMEEIAVCNIDPGFMFYTDGTPVSTFISALTPGTNLSIIDQSGIVLDTGIVVRSMTDLTGTSTDILPYGLVTVDTTGGTQLQFALKPGGSYFTTPLVTTFTKEDIVASTSGPWSTMINNLASFPTLPVLCKALVAGVSYNVALLAFSSTSVTVAYNDTAVTAALATGLTFRDMYSGGIIASYKVTTATTTPTTGSFNITTLAKATIQGWKSFDFTKELEGNDFQESIKEINPKTFRFVDFYNPGPSVGEVPLQFVPWEVYEPRFDESSVFPGLPRIITKDNTGRYRIYPQPYYTVTLKFDYVRNPQILSLAADVPKGLESDFDDVVMWKACIALGEYDEQPSLVARATKNFKTVLQRMELKNRPVFHLLPHRMY